ncbi:MAG: S8 family serine peptidase [Candidatus Eisenbacteria bacterium]|nr:S8 family serine peptidase [Candidatus Eisenbacteria bacterium]
MTGVLPFSSGSRFKKKPLSCVSMFLATAFVLCGGVGVERCQSEPAQPTVGDLTAVVRAPSGVDAGTFAASSYVRLHTTNISSRPGVFFAKGVLVVQLAQDLEPTFDGGGRLSTTERGLDELLQARGLLRAERLFPWDCEKNAGGTCNFLRLTFPGDVDLESLMNELGQTRGVASVEPVGVHPVDYYPNDYFFSVQSIQWGLNQVLDHDVNAPEAWDVEKGDSSIVVAIVDTGVDWSHPDLGGVAPYTGGNIWTNWTEFYGAAGVDDDGNGFIDDVRGWDFVTDVVGFSGEDADTPDNDPSDFFGHGTHVAGIACALTDNTTGVASLANGCKIMPVRAGWGTDDGTGKPTGVVAMDFCASAILYAARNGARVINCSWANDNSGGLGVAVDTAIARGAIVVVSAGNDHTSSQATNYLGTRGDCFAVAATNSRDQKPYYSNYGTWVNFCAPGDTIASTYYKYSTGEHAYAYYSGTSMAAPFVSALSALVFSQDPSRTRADVLDIISSTCDPIDALNPSYSGQLGAGRIDAYAALSFGTGDWQAKTQGQVTGSPVPVEAGLETYAAVTSSDGCLYVFDSGGEAVSGWPKCGLGSSLTSPAAGDVDGDGRQELVVGTGSGNVHVWSASGSVEAGWPQSFGSAVISGPMLCDLDEDGAREIVFGCADSTVYVLSGDGSPETGWPVKLTGRASSQPCLAAMGADTASVILIPTSGSRLNALKLDGSALPGWPITVGSALLGAPSAVDLDGDGLSEVFVGDSNGTVYAIEDTGVLLAGWPRAASASLTSSLALGDVDGDRVPDAVGGTSDGRVYVWKLNGQLLSGWPVETGGSVASSPALVDLDADGKCEVVVGSDDRNLHVWSSSGTPFSGWPRSTGGAVKSSPCIWDFDEDGLLELAVGSNDTKLHFWRLAGSQAVDSLMAWQMYRHDECRSGESGFEAGASVRPYAVVFAPDGGEVLREGSRFEIVWIAYSPAGVDSVSILYSVDGGATFPDTIATGEANDESYVWEVPSAYSDVCRVRVIAYDRLLNQVQDDTDGFFTILPRAGVSTLAVSAYPNPFAGTVTFRCTLRPPHVPWCCGERGKIRVCDASGRQVASLSVAGEGRTLTVSWDGGNESSRKLASGVYLYEADVDGLKTHGKLVFLKQ